MENKSHGSMNYQDPFKSLGLGVAAVQRFNNGAKRLTYDNRNRLITKTLTIFK